MSKKTYKNTNNEIIPTDITSFTCSQAIRKSDNSKIQIKKICFENLTNHVHSLNLDLPDVFFWYLKEETTPIKYFEFEIIRERAEIKLESYEQ